MSLSGPPGSGGKPGAEKASGRSEKDGGWMGESVQARKEVGGPGSARRCSEVQSCISDPRTTSLSA